MGIENFSRQQNEGIENAKEAFRLVHVSTDAFLKQIPPVPEGKPLQEVGTPPDKEVGPDEVSRILKVTLHWSEEVWADVFSQLGKKYKEPTMVLYNDSTESTSRWGHRKSLDARNGPVALPDENRIYFDPDSLGRFFRNFWGGPQTPVIAYSLFHETAHIVQKQLGYFRKLQRERNKIFREPDPSRHLVALELQADFLAGHALRKANERHQIMNEGDTERVYWAAAAVGDDFCQLRRGNLVNPQRFSHGSAKERALAFWQGVSSGDLRYGLDYSEFLKRSDALLSRTTK